MTADAACERCRQGLRVPGERFCKPCRKAVLAELKAAGYLGPGPGLWRGSRRSSDHRENTRDTKYGTDR